ncbi:MAG TPA: ATP-dependent protease ATPase subunit HslU [Candidatus Mcinerneyibacteriales bacterium]|nr:ATP-dependent protease ATPase subunit HslU [Candidatus Mcinerneyibacteriales bacterium]HPQ89945.1 ATP-dependent protease ATPase subunit HslU [Candidatus Mcinerneyibacteriales bacterium]
MKHIFTPKETIAFLDQYIIGQKEAKKAVAIALRNRWRRKQLPEELQAEILPKNILMIGPTGVGKTEIARRLAQMADAPFIKVEASKFTEVGYVGRDVESMIRDLVRQAVSDLKEEKRREVEERARQTAENKVLDLLLPASPSRLPEEEEETPEEEVLEAGENGKVRFQNTRERFREMFRSGKLDDREVEYQIQAPALPQVGVLSNVSMEEMGIDFQEMLSGLMPKKKKRSKMKVRDAYEKILDEEIEKLIDTDAIAVEAKKRVEEAGIIFIDEIDKIAGRESKGAGPDVSREGVQRDLLPIVEGSSVYTKYGFVKTDHILFIAAGAFTVSKPSDLIPELQGRFPIRVELQSLSEEEFVRILQEPKNSLIRQYSALLETEGVTLTFSPDAITRLSHFAHRLNSEVEEIGARRLYTVMEHVLSDISFEASEKAGSRIEITADYVDEKVLPLIGDTDLNAFIL